MCKAGKAGKKLCHEIFILEQYIILGIREMGSFSISELKYVQETFKKR